MKIISLVPSITEALFDFGLDETEIIGRTKFCIHPEEKVKKVEVVGGTKNLNIKKIKNLNPDLIIANKEENVKEQIEELMKDFKVWVTEIDDLDDNRKFLTDLGALLNKKETAEKFNKKIDQIFSELRTKRKKKVAYLIWKDPYMTVGSDTFINHILEAIGLENIFSNRTRYPEINLNELKSSEYVLLSTEPYPFKEKNIEELQKEIPQCQFKIVDGEAFSWYGTHLAKREDYFKNLQKELL